MSHNCIANLLKTDMIFSADGGQFGEMQPNLIRGLKGLLAFELTVTGAKTDQHSGKHGGGIANPAQALSHIISSMKDLTGKISIEDFELAAEELKQSRACLDDFIGSKSSDDLLGDIFANFCIGK